MSAASTAAQQATVLAQQQEIAAQQQKIAALQAQLAALQEAVTCSICTYQFDSDDRRPVVQPNCGHTVCLVCQNRIIQANVRNCTCPVCREPFNSALKPTCNFMLLAVVEMYQEVTMECESNDDILDLAVLLGDEDMPDLVQESEQERRFVEWHIALHGSGASSVPASEADASEADASDDVWDEWSDDDSNFLA